MASQHELEQQMDEDINEYKSCILKMLDVAEAKKICGDDVLSLRAIISLLSRTNPDLIIEESGKYLFEYKDDIKSGNINKFADANFKQKYNIDNEDYVKIIVGMQTIYKNCISAEQELVKRVIQKMLAHSARYFINKQQLCH